MTMAVVDLLDGVQKRQQLHRVLTCTHKVVLVGRQKGFPETVSLKSI
jgi:hypothetical protein